MMTDDIVKRLRKVEPDLPGDRTRWYRNPDGPEAADEIEKLRAALKPFADLAEKYGGDVDDQPLWDRDFMPVVGDLRAAKAALGESDD